MIHEIIKSNSYKYNTCPKKLHMAANNSRVQNLIIFRFNSKLMFLANEVHEK